LKNITSLAPEFYSGARCIAEVHVIIGEIVLIPSFVLLLEHRLLWFLPLSTKRNSGPLSKISDFFDIKLPIPSILPASCLPSSYLAIVEAPQLYLF
jgi:hypothetical protein